MQTPHKIKSLSIFLFIIAASFTPLTPSHAANLFIDPASPLVQVGGEITLCVNNPSGEVRWSAFEGEIERTGNSVKYKAPDKVAIDAVTAKDSAGNTGMVTVVIQEKEKIDKRFSKENANWEIFTNRSYIRSLLLSDDKKTLWVGTTGGLEERNAGNGQLKRVYTKLDGLPDNYASSLLSDGSGGLWVGTEGGGLARLGSDGNWTVFDTDNSGLPSNDVSSLLSDGAGGIWVGTHWGGLARLGSDGNWEVFDTDNSGLPDNWVMSLLSDGQGGVWVGTYGGGLARLGSDGKWEVRSGLPTKYVSSLLSDGQGGVWVGTMFGTSVRGGLARLGSDGNWTVFDMENSGLPYNDVSSLLSDGAGGLWVGTHYGGLAHLGSDGNWTVFDMENSGLPENSVESLLSDSQGGVWVGTYDGLVRLTSDGNWEVFYQSGSGLPENWVMSLLSDGQNGLWVGTEGGGLARLGSDGNWEVFDTDNSGLPDNDVSSLLSDGSGGIWVGTGGGGLARLGSDGNWTVFNKNNSYLPSNYVESLLSDGAGGIWVGTHWGGLARLGSDGNWEVFDTDNSGLPDNHVYSLLSDGSGGIWVGTYDGGLARLGSDGNWTVFDMENSGLPSNYVESLLSDGQGGIWVGTWGDLARLGSDGNWTVFDTENSGLPENWVKYLLSDGQGGLWVGTRGGGLARLGSDGNWTVFDTDNSGLPDNWVYSLLSDGAGGLWVGTMNDGGLARLTFSSSQIQDEQYLKNGQAAIIIAGGGNTDDNALWDSTTKISNYAYKMLNKRGFLNTDIYYISPMDWADFNGDGLDDKIVDSPNPARQIQLSDIQAAFDWAKTKGSLNQPLYIFFTDHGGIDQLQLAKGVYIKASELKTMLDDYQKTTGNKVVFVIDACHSGTMVKALAGENRAVISSTGEGPAYFDRLNGQSFIWYVTKGLNKGMNFNEAFYYASSEYKTALGKISQYESISAGSGTLSLTQEPQFDDNGDGLYSISVDGDWLKKVSVNGTWSNADVTLTVEAVTQSGVVSGLNPTPLKAKATLAAGVVRRVWAVIRPPQMDILVDNTGIPLVAFPKTELSASKTEESVYEGSWNGFVYNGEYEITFYAEDNDKNIESSESIILIVGDGLACPEKGSLKVGVDKQPDSTGKIVYKSGDKLKISVTENLAYGYDLYVALFMPDGNFTALKSPLTNANINQLQKENFNKLYWGERWIETNRNINMGKSVDVVDLTLPQEKLPSGQYCVYAALIPEGQDLVTAANKGLIVLDGVCFEVETHGRASLLSITEQRIY